MNGKRTLHAGLIGAVLAGGSLAIVPGIASAAVRPAVHTPHGFLNNQKLLEQQLAYRVTQLSRLASDVAGSKTLTAPHAVTLNANIGTATTNINALVTKVPTDTTQAQLTTDRASMLQQNRVFAVLTPQVFQTIEADAFGAEVLTDQSNEAALQSSVNSLAGQHGYTNALNHYVAFVRAVNNASIDSNKVATDVLAQTPADYPGDTHVFVTANHQLLNAGIALAHASYDANIIGLATGGYTGA
jgi:hypothetical protein